MSLLDGALAEVFAQAFGGVYLDAQLYRRAAITDDGMGGGSGNGYAEPETVKAQLDQATEAMRSADGFVDTDQRILVLASGVAPIDTDCRIVVGGATWSIASVAKDPAGAAYELRGRRT